MVVVVIVAKWCDGDHSRSTNQMNKGSIVGHKSFYNLSCFWLRMVIVFDHLKLKKYKQSQK